MTATTSGTLRLDSAAVKRLDEPVPADSKAWLEPGDLLVQRANTIEYVGAAAIYEGPRKTYIYPDLMMRLRIREPATRHFLWRFLNSEGARSYFRKNATGTAGNMPKINGETLRSLPVPLPPLDVQRRIVKKLDQLLSQSRAAREQLEAVPALVETFRQSVLAAAFRGDLTADWRKKNPNVEPASKLLERIRVERRKNWEEGELAKMKAKGRVAKDDKWKAKYVEPEPVGASELPELPPSWCWASANLLSLTVVDCAHSTPSYGAGECLAVDTTCMEPGSVVLNRLRRLSREAFEERVARLRPQGGDVVFAREGKVGTAVSIPDDLEVCLGQRVMLFRPVTGLARRWLEVTLNSPQVREQYAGSLSGSTVPHLNVSDAKRLLLPLAPAEEQLRILGVLQGDDEARAVLAQSAAELTVKFGALERSLLAKAFRGELGLDGTDAEVVRLEDGTAGVGAKGRRTA